MGYTISGNQDTWSLYYYQDTGRYTIIKIHGRYIIITIHGSQKRFLKLSLLWATGSNSRAGQGVPPTLLSVYIAPLTIDNSPTYCLRQ